MDIETYLLHQYECWDRRDITPRTIRQTFPWRYWAARWRDEQAPEYAEMSKRMALLLDRS